MASESRPTEVALSHAARSASASMEVAGRSVVGTAIGRYRVRRKLGDGGFGSVYLAEQSEPIRRRVALKIIKLGMDTEQVLARFEAERQALALMDHPNIATALDAGVTDDGRPYFVMELVRGISITEYCDHHRLDARARLGLFVQVCHAVQHAHQKGIIHRDVKPGNVLVAEHHDGPVPKVIDFGVAKAISQRLTERTFCTEIQQVIGTPSYMSPEQAGVDGLDVDARSDVYSLGVLLYELLTGTTPFDPRALRRVSIGEMQRMIREDPAPKPSTRLTTIGPRLAEIAVCRRTSPDRLGRALRGDLDWIVMKALEKDRTRRYDSPSALARDVVRCLEGQPVMAGPPSAAYRARKFVQRHAAMVAVAAAGSVALAIGVAVIAALAVHANHLRLDAQREATIARQVNAFLNDDLLAQADPMVEPDRDVRLRAVLDRASDRVGDRFRDEPLVEAALRTTLGNTYLSLGEYSIAERHLRTAADLRRRAVGDAHPETLASYGALADVLVKLGRLDDAEDMARLALDGQRDALGADDPATLRTMDTLATVLKDQTRFDEAEPLLLRVLERRRRTLGAENLETLTSENNLATHYSRTGRYAEAAALLERTLAVRRRLLGSEHPHTLSSQANLALALQVLGRYDEAEALTLAVVDVRSRTLGPEHPRTLAVLNNLGHLYSLQERYAEARPHYEAVYESRVRLLGPEHPHTLLSMNNLGVLEMKLGEYDRAEPRLLEMLETTERVMGADHLDTYLSLRTVGRLYLAEGRLDEAEACFRRMARGLRRSVPSDHPTLGVSLRAYGRCLTRAGRYDEAEALLEEARAIAVGAFGEVHRDAKAADAALAELERARRGSDERDPRAR